MEVYPQTFIRYDPAALLLSIIVFMMAKAMPGDALSGQEINPRANPAELDMDQGRIGSE